MGYHTLLLVQRAGPDTRMYYDCPSTTAAMERIVKMFEGMLKLYHPEEEQITYDVGHVYRFVDNDLVDLSALVLDSSTGHYAPHGKTWIKELLLKYFQHQAS